MAAESPNLSSPESESDDPVAAAAVESVVSQAIDSAILEQIVEINSADHLSCSSSLPTNIEVRFHKLKSFPVATDTQPRMHEISPRNLSLRNTHQAEITSSNIPNGKKSSDQRIRDGFSSPPPPPSSSLYSVKPLPYREHSPSPPRQVCCFGCRPSKRAPKNKQKENGLRLKNDEILTDYSTFSFKEQQRKLKAALKQEEKVSREAAKVVEWVKQASARMDVSVIDELLSDEKYHK